VNALLPAGFREEDEAKKNQMKRGDVEFMFKGCAAEHAGRRYDRGASTDAQGLSGTARES